MKHLTCFAIVLLGLASSAGAEEAAVEKVTLAGDGLTLQGYYYPATSPKPGPAIVLMHGCSGMFEKGGKVLESYAFWAEHFRKLGYSALLLDSFSPREVKEICTQKGRSILPERERSADAHAGLAWLAARKEVDPAHIHLLGWSNGAMAVLHAAKVGSHGSKPGQAFRSAVAFYPGCAQVAKERGYKLAVPLLIQSGEADDWTLARHCRDLVAALADRADSAKVEMDSYPDAHHSFDRIGLKARFRADVRNPNQPSGWGATIGSNPAAREAAIKRTTAWVEARDKAEK